jgi:hypothetical protein
MNQATLETKTHLRPWFAFAVGVGFTAALTALAAAPWPIVIVGLVPPAIAHAAIFDLALRRPEAMPVIGAFMIGILLDVIAGPIFGLGGYYSAWRTFCGDHPTPFLSTPWPGPCMDWVGGDGIGAWRWFLAFGLTLLHPCATARAKLGTGRVDGCALSAGIYFA